MPGYSDMLEEFLAKRGVTSVDDIFVSERDGQPFDIRYGLVSGPRGSTELVVLEKQGSGGKHMVAYLNMTQREVDDAEYQDLLANGGNAAAPSTGSGAGDSRGGG